MGKLHWSNKVCAAVLLCVTTAIGLSAQTFKTLHSFYPKAGTRPDAPLVQATGGNLYGTTSGGGANGLGGTVFKITPSGTLTTLYSFCSQSGCTDGGGPESGLVQGASGNFYGTTTGGGTVPGWGTVSKITPSGVLTTLHRFSSGTDGSIPTAGLVEATDGNLYGTTYEGGSHGAGTVFKITPSGTLTTLYSFCSQPGCTDGAGPAAGLVQATDGNFYGTTLNGGTNNSGTVFRITPSGVLRTLQSGGSPYAGLIQAADGNLYGTNLGGGANGSGTVFKITPSGTLTTLYSFCSESGCTDGSNPYAGLVQATDGNLYGTTNQRGANGSGTVFKITPSGTLTTLYSFCSQSECTDGTGAVAALVQDTDGNFYGTTANGGADTTGCGGKGCGTVFSLSVGLGPFVETQPASARVGGFVEILGTNLTGSTSVSFNGTSAVFRVVSNSLIQTTVPAGATTGTIEVVTPGGALSSNVPFRVRP